MKPIEFREYKNLKKMFESSDTENRTLAIAICEKLNVKANLPYLLLLYKEYKADDWKKIIKRMSKFSGLNYAEITITTDFLFNIFEKDYKDFLPLLVSEWEESLKERLKAWDYNFVDKIEFKLKNG